MYNLAAIRLQALSMVNPKEAQDVKKKTKNKKPQNPGPEYLRGI